MDKIKLAQRTIALLSSMIESGECHTRRTKEMKDNALNGLEQLSIDGVVGRSEQLVCDHPEENRTWMRSGKGSFCNKCNELVKAN